VRAKDNRLRMFMVGIGNGPNEYFIKQMARITGGAAELIAPNERIEPKVLRLFTKVASSGSIRDLKIDWGTEVVTSDIPSSAYFDETVSIFAKLVDAQLMPEKILVSGVTHNLKHEWIASLIQIDDDNLPVPLLWARTKIRQMEESEGGATGSQQSKRKENKVKLAIIDLSKKYGVVSRETSFVAVEKRLDSEKTIGEVVLRKVPVMLTRGWGGIAENRLNYSVGSTRDRDIMKTLKTLQSEDDLSVPAYMRYSMRYRGTERNHMVGNAPEMMPNRVDRTDANNGLLEILALQKAGGGFEIDPAFAMNLKSSLKELQDISLKILPKGQAEKLVLLSTVLVLTYLELKYAGQKSSWEGVVQKSRKWLEMQIFESEPSLEGMKLRVWASNFFWKRAFIS
jgi:hypothetical protein